MYLLKADSPISGSNRPCPYLNEQANPSLNREHLHDRSVLSMPATSAGVTLGT